MNTEKKEVYAFRLTKKKSAMGNEYYTGYFGNLTVYGRLKEDKLDIYFQEQPKKDKPITPQTQGDEDAPF